MSFFSYLINKYSDEELEMLRREIDLRIPERQKEEELEEQLQLKLNEDKKLTEELERKFNELLMQLIEKEEKSELNKEQQEEKSELNKKLYNEQEEKSEEQKVSQRSDCPITKFGRINHQYLKHANLDRHVWAEKIQSGPSVAYVFDNIKIKDLIQFSDSFDFIPYYLGYDSKLYFGKKCIIDDLNDFKNITSKLDLKDQISKLDQFKKPTFKRENTDKSTIKDKCKLENVKVAETSQQQSNTLPIGLVTELVFIFQKLAMYSSLHIMEYMISKDITSFSIVGVYKLKQFYPQFLKYKTKSDKEWQILPHEHLLYYVDQMNKRGNDEVIFPKCHGSIITFKELHNLDSNSSYILKRQFDLGTEPFLPRILTGNFIAELQEEIQNYVYKKTFVSQDMFICFKKWMDNKDEGCKLFTCETFKINNSTIYKI